MELTFTTVIYRADGEDEGEGEGEGEGALDVTFQAKCGGFALDLNPEFPEGIVKVDVDAETGTFDTMPWNGAFSFCWAPDKLVICVGKSGSGRGGDVDVTLTLTPSARKSLHDALATWKAAFEKGAAK